ncbi:Uncharacterised protein [uncultured archaeon]|nr:Uncharacterised protein [uncultured archaeon]
MENPGRFGLVLARKTSIGFRFTTVTYYCEPIQAKNKIFNEPLVGFDHKQQMKTPVISEKRTHLIYPHTYEGDRTEYSYINGLPELWYRPGIIRSFTQLGQLFVPTGAVESVGKATGTSGISALKIGQQCSKNLFVLEIKLENKDEYYRPGSRARKLADSWEMARLFNHIAEDFCERHGLENQVHFNSFHNFQAVVEATPRSPFFKSLHTGLGISKN